MGDDLIERKAAIEVANAETWEYPQDDADAGNNYAVSRIVDGLRALPSATQPGARVKPLVWEDVSDENICTRYTAPAMGGRMMIVALDPKTDPEGLSVGIDLGGLAYKFVLSTYADLFGGAPYTAPAKFYTLEAAKAAAQADYESRILSALDAAPLPPTPEAVGWMPPEDREDGYRCLGFETLWSTVEWREGYWLALTEDDDRLLVAPTAFAPLPPAPEGEG